MMQSRNTNNGQDEYSNFIGYKMNIATSLTSYFTTGAIFL